MLIIISNIEPIAKLIYSVFVRGENLQGLARLYGLARNFSGQLYDKKGSLIIKKGNKFMNGLFLISYFNDNWLIYKFQLPRIEDFCKSLYCPKSTTLFFRHVLFRQICPDF